MAIRDEKAVVEIIIKGQASNASIKEIEASARALSAQLKRLPVDSKAFADKTKEFSQVTARIKNIKDEMRAVGDSFRNAKPETFFDKIKTGALSVLGGNLLLRGVQAVVGVFTDAIDINKKFEASLHNLSAITGASGKDLEFYAEQARVMGATIEGGSVAVLEAFKLIGSAKPELLENKEAMALVTEQAILLSKAAGIELPDAATRLTDAMNQFGAPAQEAAKYVDVLAAASKYGAAEIPDITEALLKFGVAAKSSHIDIYESSAAIELLAEKGLKGAEAGTQLRNVFAKLSATKVLPPEAKAQLEAAGVNMDILQDKTIPLQKRIEELSKIHGNAAGIIKVFGLENKAAGEILVNNTARLAELTKQVHETGVAQEQANINTDTFNQSLIEAKNAYNDMLLEMTQGDFSVIIRDFVKGATKELNTLKEAAKAIGQLFNGKFIEGAEQSGRDILFNKIKDDASKLTEVKRKELVKQAADEIRALNAQVQNNRFLTLIQKEEITKQIEAKNLFARAIMAVDAKITSTSVNEKQNEADAVAALDKKTRHALLKAREDFLKEMQELEKKYNKRFLTDQQEEEKEVIERGNKLLAQAKGNADQQALIRHEMVAELSDIEKKYADKELTEKQAFIKKYNETIQSAELNEIDESRKKYEELIKEAKKFGVDYTELLEQQKKDEEAIRAKHATKQGDVPDGHGKKTNQFLGGPTEAWQSELNEAVGVYDQFASRVSNILESVKAHNLAMAQVRMTKNNEEMNAQLAREKRLLDNKVISQQEYDRRAGKLDEDRKKKDIAAKKETAQRNKKLASFQAVLSGAASVAKTLSEYEYPVNLVLAALDAVAVGIQIATIKNEPIPAFAGGGYSNDPSGFVHKPTLFGGSASGKPFLAGEAGSEYIVPNWMLQNPMIANTVDMLEAVRGGGAKGYAGGGFNSTNTVSKTETSNSYGEIASILKRLNNNLEGGIGVNYDNFNIISQRIEKAKSAAQVRS